MRFSDGRGRWKNERDQLSEFNRRQCEGGEHGGDQPEADDDLGFGPAFALEMMVKRGHQEDSPAFAEFSFGVFEPGDLQEDADGFGDENSADEEEHEFLADDDGD